MTIAVTGASGQLGRLIIEGLKTASNEPIIALARSREKIADLNVDTRAFDYTHADTLAPALADVDTLLLVSSSEIGQRAAQHRNVIDAAKAAGVKRIAYTSILNADDNPLELATEHRETEAVIKASGLTYIILRNGWYTENYAANAPVAVQNGAIFGSAGAGRISAATRKDYADAAVAVLTDPVHENAVLELAGDQSFTLSDLALEISQQTGTPIQYTNLPEADYATALTGFGLDQGFAAILADSDAKAANDALYSEDRTLSRIIGRPTTPLADAVAAALS